MPESAAAPLDADESRISGVPLWPGQSILMAVLFLLLLSALATLSALLPVHPSALFGPPQLVTPEVKPDWYLMWMYGTLKMIPGDLSIRLPGATIGSEAIGAMVVPGLLATIILLVPWLDRTPGSARYAEHPLRSPLRLGFGLAMLALFGVLSLAGFSAELGLSVPVLWILTLVGPLGIGWGAYAFASRRRRLAESSQPRRI
jgi:cytochrome b-561